MRSRIAAPPPPLAGQHSPSPREMSQPGASNGDDNHWAVRHMADTIVPREDDGNRGERAEAKGDIAGEMGIAGEMSKPGASDGDDNHRAEYISPGRSN